MSESVARPMPGTVPRNGMPPAGGYVYRGTDFSVPRPGRPSSRPGTARPRAQADSDGTCLRCHYRVTALGHKIACGDAS